MKHFSMAEETKNSKLVRWRQIQIDSPRIRRNAVIVLISNCNEYWQKVKNLIKKSIYTYNHRLPALPNIVPEDLDQDLVIPAVIKTKLLISII